MTWPPPLMPELVAIAGRNEEAVAEAARRYGFADHVTDWRALVADERIGLFDNSGPNNLHAEPTIAAAEAGKHVICEKPLGRDADESYETWQRVQAAGVKHMCAFNYRFVPAVRLARELIEAGELGEIHHFRGSYLQDWGTTTEAVWRFDKAAAGSGALGDLGAHVIDLARYLVGEIETVSGPDGDVPARARGRRRLRGGGRLRGRRGGDDRGHALRHRAQERLPLGGQRQQGLDRLRPRAPQRAAGPSRPEPRRARRSQGFRTVLVTRGRAPVLGALVAAGPHHRLGAHLRARAPSPADRDPRRRRRRSARRHARGRLPRRRGVRRDRALGGVGRARDACSTAT